MSDEEQKKIFSENLLKFLSETGKTQKEVADAIQVSPQTFNTWCQGIALPRMGKVQLLADYFHINKSDLLDRKLIPLDYIIYNNDTRIFIETFKSLNDTGRERALRYMEEISKIYPRTSDPLLNAAHERTDIEVTEDTKKHDDAIMNDEDF